MKKFMFPLVLALICSLPTIAQKNVVKVKPIMPAISAGIGSPIVLPLAYERVIVSKLTGQINFSYMLPKQFNVGAIDFGAISAPELKGWSVGPEIRFYPGISKEAPKGFFLAGYYKYAKNSIASGFDYTTELDVGGAMVPYTSSLEVEGYMNRTNYGIAIGSQWMIADIVSFELQWFGVAWGGSTIGVDLSGQLVDPVLTAGATNVPTWSSVADQFSGNIEDSFSGLPGPLGNTEISVSTSPNSANVEIKSPMPTLRAFSFSVGVAF